ncbi:MAG: dTDP-4-dehydrorhamnose 3,5-epimerase [Pseudomonadota bacterium]
MTTTLQVRMLGIPEVKLILNHRHVDERGFLVETYNRQAFRAAGIDAVFVQDNVSLSHRVGTVRGLHVQLPPAAQAKLVRVVRGRALDVVVDVRRGSSTFGRHVAVELANDGTQLFVPEGFAHGFCTLAPDTEVAYKLTAPYAVEHERGLHWADPALGIAWPVTPAIAIVSPRHRTLPPLAELTPGFGFAREDES